MKIGCSDARCLAASPFGLCSGGALCKSFLCLRAKAIGHSWARSGSAAEGTTEETSAKVHFHLLTKANWLLKKGSENGPVIFGETPENFMVIHSPLTALNFFTNVTN